MNIRHFALVVALAAPFSAGAADTPPADAPVASSSAAAAPAAAPATPTTAQAADTNEKVCKLERQLGSNKMKRVCRTKEQMEIDRAAARETLTREQR